MLNMRGGGEKEVESEASEAAGGDEEEPAPARHLDNTRSRTGVVCYLRQAGGTGAHHPLGHLRLQHQGA